MKKKYLFSLPIVSSLATLPFFISQTNSTNNDTNASLEKIKNDIIASSTKYSNSSIKSLYDTIAILTRIQGTYNISNQLLGLKYLYANFANLQNLLTQLNSLKSSNDYSKLVANNTELIALQSDLASEYYAAQHLEELLKNGDKDLRSYLASKASSIYANTTNKFNLSFHNGANNIAPPIKLIANAYDEESVKYLGDELTKAKKINEENQNKNSKDSSTQTEETTSSTESTPVTNNPT
ncbi:hypothetical protein, partial [Mycoplasmopsis meleagridis]|uniref:hypothetical protein n=1 Tax=Mycoplasmopsis meleagridis TaxID=29561 RepID=UPI001379EED3